MSKQQKRGISFPILVSCLSTEFKERLASGELDLRSYFKLDSDTTYQYLLYQIRQEVGIPRIYKPVPWYKRIKSLLTH